MNPMIILIGMIIGGVSLILLFSALLEKGSRVSIIIANLIGSTFLFLLGVYVATNSASNDKTAFFFIIEGFFFLGALWLLIRVGLIVRKSYDNEDHLTNSGSMVTKMQKHYIINGMRELGIYYEVSRFMTRKQARKTIRDINTHLGRKTTVNSEFRVANQTSTKPRNPVINWFTKLKDFDFDLNNYNNKENFSWESYSKSNGTLYAAMLDFFTLTLTIALGSVLLNPENFGLHNNLPMYYLITIIIFLACLGASGVLTWYIIQRIFNIYRVDWNDDGEYGDMLPITELQVRMLDMAMRDLGEYYYDKDIRKMTRADATELLNQISDRLN